MERILLMKPLGSEYHIIAPSLGLGYLATVAMKNGCSADIIDPNKEKLTKNEFTRIIQRNCYDLILIQMYSFEYYNVKACTELIRRIAPNSTIILGGPHPSGIPKETLASFLSVDFAFHGESEIGFEEFIRLSKGQRSMPKYLKKVSGLVWRGYDKIICNERRNIKNIDEIGFH